MSLFKHVRALFTPDTDRDAEFRNARNPSESAPIEAIGLDTGYRAYVDGARFVDVRESA